MPEEPKSNAEARLDLDLRKLPLEEPEDGAFSTYSNVVNLDWTLTDVRVRFAELLNVPDDERPTAINQHLIILERASIVIPWYQAKILRNMLDGVIRNYEEINGEIKQPKLPAAPASLPVL